VLRKDLKPGDMFKYADGKTTFLVPKAVDKIPAGAHSSNPTPGDYEKEVIVIASTPVTSLPYYTRNKIEAIDVIEAWGLDYPLGCVLKYLSRHGHKPGADAKEDLLKARAYITRAINRLDGKSSWDAPGGANA
jgi:Protein of unknwon function (DUF3310)